MTNKQFRTSLRRRLFLKMENSCGGQECSCRPYAPILDSNGRHLSVCKKHGYCTRTHDALVQEINGMLRYAGHRTKTEERNLFVNGNPDQKKLSPDISINNYGNTAKLLLDITVRSTLINHNNGDLVAITNGNIERVGKQALNGANSKNHKYEALSIANGFSFKPFCFETNGFVHEESVNFIKEIAGVCSRVQNIRSDVLFRYFMKILSVTLQKGIANVIIY